MTVQPDRSTEELRAEYTAAVQQERAEWKLANDANLEAVDRVQAYARWLAAAERVQALSIKLGVDPKLGTTGK